MSTGASAKRTEELKAASTRRLSAEPTRGRRDRQRAGFALAGHDRGAGSRRHSFRCGSFSCICWPTLSLHVPRARTHRYAKPRGYESEKLHAPRRRGRARLRPRDAAAAVGLLADFAAVHAVAGVCEDPVEPGAAVDAVISAADRDHHIAPGSGLDDVGVKAAVEKVVALPA